MMMEAKSYACVTFCRPMNVAYLAGPSRSPRRRARPGRAPVFAADSDRLLSRSEIDRLGPAIDPAAAHSGRLNAYLMYADDDQQGVIDTGLRYDVRGAAVRALAVTGATCVRSRYGLRWRRRPITTSVPRTVDLAPDDQDSHIIDSDNCRQNCPAR